MEQQRDFKKKPGKSNPIHITLQFQYFQAATPILKLKLEKTYRKRKTIENPQHNLRIIPIINCKRSTEKPKFSHFYYFQFFYVLQEKCA